MRDGARYEFRAFARDFGLVEDRLRELAEPSRIVESHEVYIVTSRSDASNIKIRDGRLEIKQLLGEQQGLEQWKPVLKQELPLEHTADAAVLADALALDCDAEKLCGRALPELLDEQVFSHVDLGAARVFKQRFGFLVHGCQCEIVALAVNGAWTRSCCVEAENADAVLALIAQLGLDAYTNTSYARAVRRILGLERDQLL